jgi:outer membrane lipoprotein-sorting protein
MKRSSLIIALAVLVLAVSVRADDGAAPPALTAKQIVEKANHTAYYTGMSGRAKVSMTIVDAQKRKRSRAFTILRKDVEDTAEAQVDGEQRFYVYFRNPPDLNRMVFMVHKHPGKDDDRWLYLPDLDLVKRISAADKRTSFAGSHFLYEDVSGRHVAADKHVLESTTDAYYILKSTPKDPRSVEYAYGKTWIHKKSFVVVQASTYDAEGKELRRYSALKVKNLQGHPTVVQSRMTDMRDKSYTVMAYSDVKYDIDVPDDVFTQRYLRKPPTKYLD